MIKPGNIYKDINGQKIAVTLEFEVMDMYGEESYRIFDVINQDGKVDTEIQADFFDGLELVAEYQTWQEAVNRKEFKGW